MPRKPRFFLPNIPVHIAQRGYSREPVFLKEMITLHIELVIKKSPIVIIVQSMHMY
jgi:REP element-mobilizing transposase RayT